MVTGLKLTSTCLEWANAVHGNTSPIGSKTNIDHINHISDGTYMEPTVNVEYLNFTSPA